MHLMKNNICCIFNLAAHYNAPIFRLMDSELKCDFYSGDRLVLPIKSMDYKELSGFKQILHNKFLIYNFYWQKGAVNLAFKSYRTYIITGEPYCLSTWIILVLAKVMRKNTILWTHGWYGNETFIKQVIKKMFFKLSFKVLLYGNYAKNLMIKEGIKPEKLITIYNSLDYDKQLEVRKTLCQTNIYQDHFLNKFPTLIYVGRLQKNKKLELLISAINLLNKKEIFCNLIIIGKEVENTNIQEIAEKYGINKFVWFYGPCYEEDKLGELIYNSDLCVVPGDIGLTIMHSFVYGTPVITHNNFPKHGPEFEAIKEGITGDFFEENSIDDLCLKISKWIKLPSDKRDHIRLRCHDIINETYNPHAQIETLKKVMLESM